MINPASLGATPSDSLIRGSAVTTIVPSSSSMKKHPATSSATLRRRRAAACGDEAGFASSDRMPDS